jgi:hypothetical protein
MPNKKYTIQKLGDYSYSIQIHHPYNKPLYRSLTKYIKSSYYDDESDALLFTAEKVETLKEYILQQPKLRMSLGQIILMIDQLTKQIHYLQTLEYGFYGFDIDDIIVINDNAFVFSSSGYLMPLIENTIIFYSPINKPYFFDPELLQLTTLPAKLNYKCVYYSLGVLVLFCLLNTYLLVGNEAKSQKQMDQILLPLRNTKIYWFLKRCFDSDLDKRILLLI